MTKSAFILRMSRAVVIAKQRKVVIGGIERPVILNGRAVTAQGALESGWGNSKLARVHNNLFGMKKGSSWTGPTVRYMTYEQLPSGAYIRIPSDWRVYPSWNLCLLDYSRMIQTRRWFQDALPHADPPFGDGDERAWIFHLVDQSYPGELRWATSLAYVHNVVDRVAAEIEEMGVPV